MTYSTRKEWLDSLADTIPEVKSGAFAKVNLRDHTYTLPKRSGWRLKAILNHINRNKNQTINVDMFFKPATCTAHCGRPVIHNVDDDETTAESVEKKEKKENESVTQTHFSTGSGKSEMCEMDTEPVLPDVQESPNVGCSQSSPCVEGAWFQGEVLQYVEKQGQNLRRLLRGSGDVDVQDMRDAAAIICEENKTNHMGPPGPSHTSYTLQSLQADDPTSSSTTSDEHGTRNICPVCKRQDATLSKWRRDTEGKTAGPDVEHTHKRQIPEPTESVEGRAISARADVPLKGNSRFYHLVEASRAPVGRCPRSLPDRRGLSANGSEGLLHMNRLVI
ncbi:hypothetical protein Bbelb_193330 [Branchiostoma belcheri]|nr:hypothetical protein Bbelb_193330 [Branchiostoma belcheri]